MIEMLPLPPSSASATCGYCDTDPCICAELRTYVHAHGKHLALDGLSYGQAGDFQRGRSALREALASGVQERWTYEAAGLCALATGDVAATCASWEAALALDATSPALAWLSSLKSGPIRSALQEYDIALDAAVKGNYELAKMKLSAVLGVLPDFLPGQQLGAVLARPDCSTLTEPQPHTTRWFHASITRVVGGIALASLIGVGFVRSRSRGDERQRAKSTPAPSVRTGDKPIMVIPKTAHSVSPRSDLDIRTVVALALGGDPDSLAAIIARADTDSVAWSPSIRQRAAAFRLRVARRHFRRARRARIAGLDSIAVRGFTAAVELGTETYLEDDALYELAQTQAHMGSRDNAAATATRLLRTYPRSIYANSTMKALAGGTPDKVRY